MSGSAAGNGQHGHEHSCHSHPRQHDNGDDDRLEQEALGKIIFAFRQYMQCTEQEISRWEQNYRELSARHRTLLHHLPAKAAAARAAVQQNQMFFKGLLMDFAEEGAADGAGAGDGVPDSLSAGALSYADELEASHQRCQPGDAEKVRYVLKNLIRDWSAEGVVEREQCYGRIVNKLKECFSSWSGDAPPRVLLPGAGLGRLCAEVAAAGFEAQGNEFSYFMLLTAAFMLNSTTCQEQWTIHPWVHMTCNNVTNADQLRGIGIPDQVPSQLVPPGMLSMCAGDFAEVYARPEMAASFDCVVTSFFIDTAHNILEYLEVIHHVLKQGGFWIHLGPLLWHWADGSWEELSIELCLTDVQQAALLMGFDLLHQEFVDAAYIANIRSMYKTVYQASFWTMVKTDRQLPTDLHDLVRLLAVTKQQQQQDQQQQQQQKQPQQQQQEGTCQECVPSASLPQHSTSVVPQGQQQGQQQGHQQGKLQGHED